MRVAVVGAGISGLRAASRLHAAGMDVQLFDKARGAGGRMSTRRTPSGPFDHGAQYLTVRDPRFRRVVDEWLEQGIVARWDARLAHARDGRLTPEPTPSERFVGRPGMSAIARAMRGELPAEFGVRIEQVSRVAEGWRVTCDAGFDFGTFDAAVIATPAPQAVPILESAPALAALARVAAMAPCHAVLACFVEPPLCGFDGAFVEGDALAWAARNAGKPGREGGECWVLHSSPKWSEEHVDARPEEVESALLGDFRQAIGRDLPDLEAVSTHRWLFARPIGAAGQPRWDAERRIGVCGDWLVGDRVEDAFLSGDVLADRILAAERGA